jgi:hypothetical protein
MSLENISLGVGPDEDSSSHFLFHRFQSVNNAIENKKIKTWYNQLLVFLDFKYLVMVPA